MCQALLSNGDSPTKKTKRTSTLLELTIWGGGGWLVVIPLCISLQIITLLEKKCIAEGSGAVQKVGCSR